jgi:hypothetical protein
MSTGFWSESGQYKRRTIIAITGTVLVMATAAVAYYFVAGLGEGEGSAKLGKGTASNYSMKVSFAEGLTPGAKEPADFVLEPPQATTITKLIVTPTIDKAHAEAGCEASWFSVTTANGFWKEVLEGKQQTKTAPNAGKDDLDTMFAAGIELAFAESGTNQSACEGATLTLKAVAYP